MLGTAIAQDIFKSDWTGGGGERLEGREELFALHGWAGMVGRERGDEARLDWGWDLIGEGTITWRWGGSGRFGGVSIW